MALKIHHTQFTTKPNPLTPPELSGVQQTPVEVPIQSTTPPTSSDETCKPQLSTSNPKAEGSIYERKPAILKNRRYALLSIMWQYAGDLAREFKRTCPIVRVGRCACQSNSDRVLTDLDLLKSNAIIIDEYAKALARLLTNMLLMLGHFWCKHGGDHPPSQFDLGSSGLLLIHAFRKSEFQQERSVFERLFVVQYRRPLDQILGEDSMPGPFEIEQMLDWELGKD